jgi:wobble nucleotide-excising tRNase
LPALPIIKRIASLKELGVFRNFAAPADLPDFQRHNLIYGFNGSGKTILSRVFASLGEGTARPELPEGGTFEVELTGETVIKSTGALDALKGRVLVFNVDFIEENLRWKEGTANPVFYLGRAQAELAKKLEETEAAMTTLTLRREEATREHAQKERAFTDHKRDDARLIAEQLSLGRRYDASDLIADHAKSSYDEKLKLSEAERQQLRTIITQDAPLAKRDPLGTEPFGLVGHIREVRKILDTTLGTMALKDLREHEMMLKWVKEGVDYHQKHDLSSCLFCGNELTEERMLALGQAIDERFDRLTGDIADANEKTERLRDRLTALKRAIPSNNDISKELLNRFALAASDLQASLARGAEIVGTVLALLEKKAAAPNVRADTGDLATEADAAERLKDPVHF